MVQYRRTPGHTGLADRTRAEAHPAAVEGRRGGCKHQLMLARPSRPRSPDGLLARCLCAFLRGRLVFAFVWAGWPGGAGRCGAGAFPNLVFFYETPPTPPQPLAARPEAQISCLLCVESGWNDPDCNNPLQYQPGGAGHGVQRIHGVVPGQKSA